MFRHIGRLFGYVDTFGLISKDIVYLVEVILAVGIGQPARRRKPVRTHLAGEVQNTGAVLMRFVDVMHLFKHFTDIMLYILVDSRRLRNERLRTPFGYGPVLGAQMLRIGRMTELVTVARVVRNLIISTLHLHIRRCIGYLKLLADESMGNTVKVGVVTQTNVTVFIHRGH